LAAGRLGLGRKTGSETAGRGRKNPQFEPQLGVKTTHSKTKNFSIRQMRKDKWGEGSVLPVVGKDI
jgi:hypothetical protein